MWLYFLSAEIVFVFLCNRLRDCVLCLSKCGRMILIVSCKELGSSSHYYQPVYAQFVQHMLFIEKDMLYLYDFYTSFIIFSE